MIGADVKEAFKCVVIHLDSLGSLAMCMDFEDWIYDIVYSRTPFGWKRATHTFSPYAKAIKPKVRNWKELVGVGRTQGETRLRWFIDIV